MFSYLTNLAKFTKKFKKTSNFAITGYEDFLQSPLQPLMDNLESGTYEVFEKDPVKYREYQNAIHLALMDKNDSKNETLVMVLGAGRGPLVRATLRVSITVHYAPETFKM